MNSSHIGALLGAVLTLTWLVLGFWQFVLVGLGVAVGILVGRYLEGRLDVAGLVSALRGRRSV